MSGSKNIPYYDQTIALRDKILHTPGMLPAAYYFHLSSVCNLKCPKCVAGMAESPEKRPPPLQMLGIEEWKEVLDQLPQYASICFSGPEPLTSGHFNDVFRAVAEKFTCALTTNGTLLDSKTIDLITAFKNFKILGVSINDVGNSTRGFTPRQWERLEGGIMYFNELKQRHGLGTLLDVKTLILDENAPRLLDIHRYCVEKLHCATHTLILLTMPRGPEPWSIDQLFAPHAAPLYRDWGTIVSQLDLIRAYQVQQAPGSLCFITPKVADLQSARPLPDLDYLNTSFHDPRKFQPCKLPGSSLIIWSDGTVTLPCMPITLGKINEMSLRDITFGETAMAVKQAVLDHGTVPACNKCCRLIARNADGIDRLAASNG